MPNRAFLVISLKGKENAKETFTDILEKRAFIVVSLSWALIRIAVIFVNAYVKEKTLDGLSKASQSKKFK